MDLSNAENLTVKDLLPDEKDLRRSGNAFHAEVYNIINQFFGKQMLRKTDGGKLLDPITPWEVYQIPPQRTIVFTLPTFNQNEALIVDMIEILRGIARELGFESVRLGVKVVMYKEDYLTVRNIWYLVELRPQLTNSSAIELHEESFIKSQLGYVLPITGFRWRC